MFPPDESGQEHAVHHRLTAFLINKKSGTCMPSGPQTFWKLCFDFCLRFKYVELFWGSKKALRPPGFPPAYSPNISLKNKILIDMETFPTRLSLLFSFHF